MHWLQALQLIWPIKLGLMYCLQDLQLWLPFNVGLMYCLQDLELSWPVKAVWREIYLLTSFNILPLRSCWHLLIGVLQCHITPEERLQTALILHYCAIPVRLPVNCNWRTCLPSDCNECFCCFVAITAQIALSPNWDWRDFHWNMG